MGRRFFVGGNFKMNPATLKEKVELVEFLNQAELDEETEVVIAPPTLYVMPTSEIIRKDVSVAAQNCFYQKSGAYTGEISACQLRDAGITWVILGHSERRTLFGETTELVAKKTVAALDVLLSVILCIGETLEERESEKTEDVVKEQLDGVIVALKGKEELWENVVIAYEPVWAIGTGKVATSAQAQETHLVIRKYIAEKVSEKTAEEIRIIYGGSVNSKNCKELSTQPDIDGFLVGGASLKPEFVEIINVNKKKES